MRSGKIILIVFLLFSLSLKASEQNFLFDSANAAYARSDFEGAIKKYEELLAGNKVSAELYYNLGNAHYKVGHLGLAILNYERAKKLSPEDEDIAANIKFANQKTEDKIEAAPKLFLAEWKSSIVELMDESSWSIVCICMICLGLFFIALYISLSGKVVRQLSFYTGSILLILSTATFFLARHKYHLETFSNDAVITSPSVTVTGSPSDKGTRLFILHEGTKVEVLEESDGWSEIKIINGNTGWIKDTQIEKI